MTTSPAHIVRMSGEASNTSLRSRPEALSGLQRPSQIGQFMAPLTISPVRSSNSSRMSVTSPTASNLAPYPLAPQSYASSLTDRTLQYSPAPASPSIMSPTAVSETAGYSKSPADGGLIRKLSRGARDRFRRRASGTNSSSRDHSAGPVIVRRRSDTGKAPPNNDSAIDVSDLELDDDAIEDGIDSVNSSVTALNPPSRSSTGLSAEIGVAPAISKRLECGTFLTKIAKKRRKQLLFQLNPDAGKITWSRAQPSKQIYIDDITEVRDGWDAENRDELQLTEGEDKRWFTIVYTDPNKSKGRNVKTMQLVAENEATKKDWVESIEHAQRQRIRFMTELAKGTEEGVRRLWTRETRKQLGKDIDPLKARLNFSAVRAVCRRLDINCSDQALRAMFNKVDNQMLGDLNLEQFQLFVKGIKERKDIKEIYNRIKPADQDELDFESFLHFLKQSQKLDTEKGVDGYRRLFEHFAKRNRPKDPATPPPVDQLGMYMNLEAFQDCMVLHKAFYVIQKKPTMALPLTQPLNEYFISSSHNTYLLGRQVAGHSSTEAYKVALMRGCRCVEIDCWDGKDGKPVVTHGRTYTQAVPFIECIKVINEFAFHTYKYPLIISLEVHCNWEQQAIMTKNMIDIFGDKLVQEPLTLDLENRLPSPEDLKERILIKVKAYTPAEEVSPTQTESVAVPRRARGFSSPFARPTIPDSRVSSNDMMLSPTMMSPPERTGSFFGTPRAASIISATTGTMTGLNTPSTSGEDSDGPVDFERPSKKTNICEVLGKLGVYTQGTKYHGDFRERDLRTFNHVLSFAEKFFDAACTKEADSKEQLELHNKKYLMRVYPSMHRISSTNFDPLKYWRRGVQMAALNWQTYDLGMQLNEAMFAAGDDQSGYVLKPDDMRPSTHGIEFGRKKGKHCVKFNIEIISAQQLPRLADMNENASINPYIEFEVHTAEDKARGVAIGQGGRDASARDGMLGIGSPLRKRTAIVRDNGYDPAFNENISMTVETKYPSLVFIRWTVWNSPDGRSLAGGNVPLASYTAKLDSVQEGYRHIPLYNARSEKYYFSTLFCKINKEPTRPVEHWQHTCNSVGEAIGPLSPQSEITRASVFKRVFSRTPSQRNGSRKQSITVNTNVQNGYFASGSATGDSSTLSRTSSVDGRIP